MEPPLTPDADEARRWAEQELAKPIYNQGESLLERAWTAFIEWFSKLSEGAGIFSAALVPLVILALIIAVVTAAFILGGPVRRRRHAQQTQRSFLDEDDTRTIAQLLAAAEAAVTAGDFGLAIVERFRALVRTLDERAIGTSGDGRTAQEAARSAAADIPQVREDLLTTAHAFDDVRYGKRVASARDYETFRDHEARVLAAKPQSTPASWART